MFPELDTSTTSTTQADRAWITVPTDKLTTYTIFDTSNDKKLKNIARADYIRRTGRADTDQADKPTHWLTMGTKYYLYPTPDAAYVMEVFYRKRPADMSASTDVTVIGSEWDEVVLKLAVIQSMMRLKDYEKAEIEKKEWLDVVASKIQLYRAEMGDRADYLKPDPSYNQWGY